VVRPSFTVSPILSASYPHRALPANHNSPIVAHPWSQQPLDVVREEVIRRGGGKPLGVVEGEAIRRGEEGGH
jgi:hypothetical protein